MPNDNPYEILGVTPDQSFEDITKKYRQLALKCHPDKVLDEDQKPAAEEQFKQISNAYDMIKQMNEAQSSSLPQPTPSASAQPDDTDEQTNNFLFSNTAAMDPSQASLYDNPVFKAIRAFLKMFPNEDLQSELDSFNKFFTDFTKNPNQYLQDQSAQAAPSQPNPASSGPSMAPGR